MLSQCCLYWLWYATYFLAVSTLTEWRDEFSLFLAEFNFFFFVFYENNLETSTTTSVCLVVAAAAALCLSFLFFFFKYYFEMLGKQNLLLCWNCTKIFSFSNYVYFAVLARIKFASSYMYLSSMGECYFCIISLSVISAAMILLLSLSARCVLYSFTFI